MKLRFSRIICLITVIAILFTSTIIPVYASSPELDFSINKETAQLDSVRNTFLTLGTGMRSTTDIQGMATAYIPDGARCTDISTIGDTVYIDYQLNSTRYLVAYYSDGSVQKGIRQIGSNDAYFVDSKNPIPQHTNISETLQEISISEEEAHRRMTELQSEQNIENPSYPLENSNARATKVAQPISYTSVSSTAPYKAKNVLSGSLYLSSLGSKGYSTSQPYTVYETMSYHTEVVKKTQAFAIGKTLVNIATAFIVPASTVKVWLNAAGIAFSTSGILQEACQVVAENEYTYLGGKECGIYDPTSNNRQVEVYSNWGEGRITMTWSYNSATGYNNPTWGHSTRSPGLQETNTSVRNEGQRIYNTNINTYGLWKWGPGNGFGY